jgi:hypothetical protein
MQNKLGSSFDHGKNSPILCFYVKLKAYVPHEVSNLVTARESGF